MTAELLFDHFSEANEKNFSMCDTCGSQEREKPNGKLIDEFYTMELESGIIRKN